MEVEAVLEPGRWKKQRWTLVFGVVLAAVMCTGCGQSLTGGDTTSSSTSTPPPVADAASGAPTTAEPFALSVEFAADTAGVGDEIAVSGVVTGPEPYRPSGDLALGLVMPEGEYASIVAWVTLEDGRFATGFELGRGDHHRPVELGTYYFAVGYENGTPPLVVDASRPLDVVSLPPPSTSTADTPLVISEVRVGGPPGPNVWWVTITNRSTETVDLSGWSLGDVEPPTDVFELPERALDPGEYVIVWYGWAGNTVCDMLDVGRYIYHCSRDPDGDGHVFNTWNLYSDEAVLMQPDGTVVSTWRYPALRNS